jgi:ketosteroid isomerase-like protein
MRRYINSLLLVLLLGLPTALAAQSGGNQRQDVLAFVRAYVDASNRGDMTAYVNMYAQRPDLVVVGDGQISRGWESVREEAIR